MKEAPSAVATITPLSVGSCGSNEYFQRFARARRVPAQMTSQTRPEGGRSPRRT